MFKRIRKDVVDDFISSHSEHIVTKVFLGRLCLRIRTEKITASVASESLDLLLISNGKDKYYILPWPKSLFKYTFSFFLIVGTLGFWGGGWVFLLGAYLSAKIIAAPILWDINLTEKK